MRNRSQIIVGDALSVLRRISDNYIDCCVTSPPYFGLRDYGVDGQIGLEETPEEYIEKMVEIFREVRRTLKPDGTLWLNLGDSYAGNSKGTKAVGCKRKELIGMPWRLALALREDGWHLRQDIVWYKPNTMPESVKDRCTKSHEYIFLLTKSDKYYFDAEAIKEPAVGYNDSPPAGSRGTARPNARRRKGNARTFRGGGAYVHDRAFDNSASVERESNGNAENKTGLRNKRDVWCVATNGYKKAHFATFPEKLIEPCILAGSKKGDVILDPFIGSGTTAVVARKNGRDYIGIELNHEYAELAKERIATTEGSPDNKE